MSEKATLLTSIPPVKKASSSPSSGDSGSSSLLKSVPPKDSGPQQTLLTASGKESVTSVQPEAKSAPSRETQSAISVSSETQATVAVEEASSITAFQGIIYVSFVLTFCLAGMAAVILFRKGLKSLEARFVQASKSLGILCAWAALSGFFATYLYANYLNGKSDAAPLAWLMFFWVVAGPLIGVALNHLLTPGKKAEMGRIAVDGIVYACIFGAAMIAVVDGLKENAVLLFSLLGCFLFIIPVARFMSLFKTAKARHPELREGVDQALIYSLLILPGLFPILAFARVCGMSPDLFIFLFNFLTFDFILVAACTMVMALPDEAEVEAASSAESEAPAPVAAQAEPQVAQTPKPQPTKPAVVAAGLKPKKLTPVKPPSKPRSGDSNGALPSAPKKPASSSEGDVSAPNAPSRIKAPAKPKKRF